MQYLPRSRTWSMLPSCKFVRIGCTPLFIHVHSISTSTTMVACTLLITSGAFWYSWCFPLWESTSSRVFSWVVRVQNLIRYPLKVICMYDSTHTTTVVYMHTWRRSFLITLTFCHNNTGKNLITYPISWSAMTEYQRSLLPGSPELFPPVCSSWPGLQDDVPSSKEVCNCMGLIWDKTIPQQVSYHKV